MAFAPRLILPFLLLGSLWAQGQESTSFRQWIAGQEAGGATRKSSRGPAGERLDSHEWTHLERMGAVIEQDLQETAVRAADGSMTFSWTLALSQEPLQGEASWSPKAPTSLQVTFRNGPPRTVSIPADVLLWPGDLDDRLRAAAGKAQPVRLKGYSLPTQQWTLLDLAPVGPEPLPGFPDTLHYHGKASEGTLAEEVDLWISPTQGEIKHQGTLAGIPLLSQRVELPAPGRSAEPSLFERTIKTLPPHPFLLWIGEVDVRWSGRGVQALPEDPQQRKLADNRYRLTRATPPAPADAAQRPVQGKPAAEDAPYLAATPLAQFNDPVFTGLLQRLRAPEDATRWELAQRITTFVYDWIKDKNYTVGFASAQEVARTPRGDCTEHGVLAVALLRRLGVPARGVTGWVAFGESLGLHFWVEARIGKRWIPLDPTFDQAPASTYRLKLGSTDLADLGSVGWENAALSFLEGSWIPEAPWAAAVRTQGDTVITPDGLSLRVPEARWHYADGRLELAWNQARHEVAATPRPAPDQFSAARRLQGANSGREGWWDPAGKLLRIDLGGGRWLQVEALSEALANRLLDRLELHLPPARSRPAAA